MKIRILCLAITFVFSCGVLEEITPDYDFPNASLHLLHDFGSDDFSYPTWSTTNDMIVFCSMADIWSISTDGSEIDRIITTTGQATYTRYCPVAGTNKLLFVDNIFNSSTTTEYNVCTLAEGEIGYKIVKSLARRPNPPSWTHDGNKIVFYYSYSYWSAAHDGISWISSEGGEITQIPSSVPWNTVDIRGAEANPAAAEVIYLEKNNNGFSLNAISLDGGDPETIHNFTSDPVLKGFTMSVSNDGSMIAIMSFYPTNMLNLFLIQRNGGDPILLTEFEDETFGLFPNRPCWAPDGDKLAILISGTALHLVELKL